MTMLSKFNQICCLVNCLYMLPICCSLLKAIVYGQFCGTTGRNVCEMFRTGRGRRGVTKHIAPDSHCLDG